MGDQVLDIISLELARVSLMSAAWNRVREGDNMAFKQHLDDNNQITLCLV
jgi:hypothetical protein